MKYTLPILTAVLAAVSVLWWPGWFAGSRDKTLAQTTQIDQPLTAPTGSLPTPDATGQELVQQAVAKLRSERSFEAKVRQRVQLFDRQIIGAGRYLQQSNGRRWNTRMELKLQIGDEAASVLQVSDGRSLWIRRDYPGQRNLARVNLEAVRRAVGQAGLEPAVGGVGVVPMGGVPDLLAGLEQRFDFGAPRPLAIRDTPVWHIEGRWRPTALARLLPAHERAIRAGRFDLAELPPQIPSGVQVVLSRSDLWPLFPYRIQFDRATDEGVSPLVTMEFFEVRRDVQIEPGSFQYPADEGELIDITDKVIRRIQAQRGVTTAAADSIEDQTR
ncbi:MAG: hypothetical protein QGG36_31510 [Pirellulaceae bacterium]|jgi:hypothetical protein|nr:hypothetical protein [Pirellulaceae bacterium]MDP7020368.1 hypothetical protein [Pirellulaceae bacterium]